MNQHRDQTELFLSGTSLSVENLVEASRCCPRVRLTEDAKDRIQRGRTILENYVQEGKQAYGVTTGVGSQKDFPIAESEVESFNRRLVTAHATVVSDRQLDPEVVRASLIAQVNKFANGLSGVRLKLVKALCDMASRSDPPAANLESSVGAGDLVPLAQISLGLLGISNPLENSTDKHDKILSHLSSKEALSLINSNSVSLGHGAILLSNVYRLLCCFDLSFCMSLEGFRGNTEILEKGVREANPEPGHVQVLKQMKRLLNGSKLLQQGESRNIQDPLSFRCAPQVHGAAYDCLTNAWSKWEHALGSVEDNPVVDLDSETLLHHGNMDTTYLTLKIDQLRQAIAKVVEISTRRLDKMHWPAFSDLPSGLTREAGPEGGVQFLNLSHITESHAAIVREMANPSLLNYQGQLADGIEDHAALLPHSVRKLSRLLDSAYVVQAIELAIGVWAIHRRGIQNNELGKHLQPVYSLLVPHLPIDRDEDDVFDLRPIVDRVRNGEVFECMEEVSTSIWEEDV